MMWNYNNNVVLVRESIPSDIKYLATRLREPDKIEVLSTGETPEEALRISYDTSSFRFSIVFLERVICMFGIVPKTLLGEEARIWCLGADEIDQIKLSFAKISKLYIGMFLEHYLVLENWVDSRYARSINWLRWCGAEFDLMGTVKDGTIFHHFVFRRR
jgi:hypothetical protein